MELANFAKKLSIVITLALFLILGWGLATHMTLAEQQPQCETGFLAKIQAALIPSAQAQGSSCAGFCEAVGCGFGGEWCDSCYDGDWTYCVEKGPGEQVQESR